MGGNFLAVELWEGTINSSHPHPNLCWGWHLQQSLSAILCVSRNVQEMVVPQVSYSRALKCFKE